MYPILTIAGNSLNSHNLSSGGLVTKLEPIDSSPRSECMSVGAGSTGSQSAGNTSHGSSLPIPADPVVTDASTMGSFSVENIMTSMPSNNTSTTDYVSAGLMNSARSGQTPQGLSSLPTYRGTESYRSPSCSSQGSSTTQASPINYHCSQAIYSDPSRQHMSIQDDMTQGLTHAGLTQAASLVGASAAAVSSTANVLNITPQAQAYSRTNAMSWYMPPSTDAMASVTPDMSASATAYANMFGQASSSCQLSAAAFRTPYKNASSYPTYDCNNKY